MRNTSNTKPKSNRARGRPIASRNIRVLPEFHKQPDLQLLARAFIAVANSMAEKKQEPIHAQDPYSREGDSVP